jgi:F-type H+-transporting ATPase subunit gamma
MFLEVLMETLESLQRRIRSAEDLGSIVKTMKTLAAVSIRQYERAVEALAEYNRSTEMGLQVVLTGWDQNKEPVRKQASGCIGVIVFGSDQGMCGQFNEHIVSHTLAYLDNMQVGSDDRAIVSVGVRTTARLEESGQKIEDIYTLPGSAPGITVLVQRLLLVIEKWRMEREIERVFLFYNQLERGIAYRSVTLRMLPISLEKLSAERATRWTSRSLPIFTMERERLLSALIRQHIFVLLFRAFAESMASENASRLITMQTAEKNIDERLEEFFKTYHELRQSTITSEILDIISGLEALSEQ